MHPAQYLAALRKRWPVLIALATLGLIGGLLYASSQPVLYRATSSVFVSSQRGQSASELVQGSTFTQNLVESYAELVALPVVLDPVLDELGLDLTSSALAKSVTAEISINTVIIDITVSDTSPQLAAELANAIAGSLDSVAERLAPTVDGDQPAIDMTSVATATAPEDPYAPNTAFFLLTGMGLGLALGYLYALARELFDVRVRSAAELVALDGFDRIPLLGTLAARRSRRSSPLVMSDRHSPEAEQFRRLCTNLEFAGIDRRIRSVTVTSAVPGDGKTTTSVNLATAMAERTGRVLLVDADLRRPSVANYLNIEGAVGLTNVLRGTVSAEDAIQRVGAIDVLPAGTPPPNIAQLVISSSMSRLFSELIAHYDFVVFDSPPLLAVTDGLTFAKLTDGVLLVARENATKRHQLTQAAAALSAVDASVIGVVLNGVSGSESRSYGYAPSGDVPDEVLVLQHAENAPVRFFRNAPAASLDDDTREPVRARR